VKPTIDLKNPPALTEEQKVRLAALAALQGDQIDTSNAPSREGAVWVKAVDFPHAKKLISLRIDEDVIEFLPKSLEALGICTPSPASSTGERRLRRNHRT
jgi:uncharacterized protein (DUF4415 family)